MADNDAAIFTHIDESLEDLMHNDASHKSIMDFFYVDA